MTENIKNILLVSDDSEFMASLDRCLRYVHKLEAKIFNPLGNVLRPIDWRAAWAEIEKVARSSDPSNTVVVVNASLPFEGALGFHHTGMEFVHSIRATIESTIPIVVYCIEKFEQFSLDGFHRILSLMPGHYYWNPVQGASSLVEIIKTAKPVETELTKVRKAYCTHTELISRILHDFTGELNLKTKKAKQVLLDALDKLELILPGKPYVRKTKEIAVTLPADVDAGTVHDLMRTLFKREFDMEFSDKELAVKVLLVEDNLTERKEAREELEKRGLQIVDTESSNSALEIVRSDERRTIEAALLDWILPGQQVQGQDLPLPLKRENRALLALALTSVNQPTQNVVKTVQEKGFDDYFDKNEKLKHGVEVYYDRIAQDIRKKVIERRRILPRLLKEKIDKNQRAKESFKLDVFYRLRTSHEWYKEEEAMSRKAREIYELYSGGNFTKTLGDLLPIESGENIVNLLIRRRVIIAMYDFFRQNDYDVYATLNYDPQLPARRKGRDEGKKTRLVPVNNVIQQGLESARNLQKEIMKQDVKFDDLQEAPEDFGFSKIVRRKKGTLFEFSKKTSHSERSPDDPDDLQFYEKTVNVKFFAWDQDGFVEVLDGLKYCDAFQRILDECGMYAGSILHPEALFDDETLWLDQIFTPAVAH